MGNSVSTMLSNNPLVKAAVLDFGIQWTLGAVAAYFQTEKFYDLAGSGTFLLLAWLSLGWSRAPHGRQYIQTSCISLWALRLGTFLFARILSDGKDRRFDKVRGNPSLFLFYWTIQGVWIWMTMWPSLTLNSVQEDKPLGWRDYLGWSMWGMGFLLEMFADQQKSRFREVPDNRGKWIDKGLWGLCRHPNYLGEIMMWFGLFLPASSVMKRRQLVSVASPLFVAYLLLKVSGVPILERNAERKWGHLALYQEYKKRTAKLIPFIW